MLLVNDSAYVNNSYTFFGPVGMAFYEDGVVLKNTFTVKILLSISLGIIMILTIIGNTCTCAVIARNRSMRTPTNCYLFNLAITDLLMALFIPMEVYIVWIPDFYPLGEVACCIHFVLWDCLSNCSILIITAFTIERYIVVKKPFLRQKLSLNSRVFKIVGVIWVISCCFCIPDLYYIDLLERKKYVFCHVTMSYVMSVFVTAEIFVFYVVPLTVIVVLYTLITIELSRAQKKLRSCPANGQQNRDRAVKMLAAVALCFFLFWSPYCVLRILLLFPDYTFEDHYDIWKIVNYLCYNSYVSSAVNPILYSLMSQKFRRAFKEFFKGRRQQNDSTPHATI